MQQILDQVNILRQQSAAQAITQVEPSTIVQLPCPVCGIYFGTAEGLHQHLHRQHPDVEQASKIRFNRSKHSLFWAAPTVASAGVALEHGTH